MNCEQVRSRYSPYHERELNREETTRMEQHLDSCPGCSERFTTFQAALAGIGDLPRHPVPRSFTASVLERVAEDTPGLERRGPSLPWGAVARWAAGVLLGITVCLVYIAMSGDPQERVTIAPGHSMPGKIAYRLDTFDAKLNSLFAEQERSLRERLVGIQRGFAESQESIRALELAVREDREHLSASEKRLTAELGRRFEAAEQQLGRWQEESEVRTETPPRSEATHPQPDASEELVAVDKPIDVSYEDGRLVWKPDEEHPEYIATLFAIYEDGEPQARRMALRFLDKLFASATSDLAPGARSGVRGFVEGIFGSQREDEDPMDPGEAEDRRIETYREYWNTYLRNDSDQEEQL